MDIARRATSDCVCANLRRATRAVTKFYDDALKPAGLKVTQFSLLGSVSTLGTATLGELAKEMVVDRTTLTRNLEILEARGLVASEEGADRRERQLRLTKEGVATLVDAYPLWQAAQRKVMELTGQSCWSHAAPALRKLATIDE